MSHTFNWQESDRNSMLHWLLPTVLNSELIDTLSPMTDHFSEVELSLRINNIEVDVVQFMDGMQRSLDHGIEEGIKDKLADMAMLRGLEETMDDLQSGVRAKIREIAKDAGISLDEEDWHRR